MVRALDLQFGGPEFMFHSSEFKSSAMFVNSSLVCLRLFGILKFVKFNLNCFRFLLGPSSISAINTAEGK